MAIFQIAEEIRELQEEEFQQFFRDLHFCPDSDDNPDAPKESSA